MRRILTANGEYFIFHAPGGVLTDDAVSAFRTAARTGACLLYGDEIQLAANGRETPVKKPAPSPDTLLSYNYIGSPVAASAALVARIGPPASGSYAERWGFAMRAFFAAEFVLHIPRVLYIGPAEKREADTELVAAQLTRLRREGAAYEARADGCVTLRYSCPPKTLLSVVVAVQGRAEALRDTLDAIDLWTTETRLQYIIAEGGAPSERNEPYYRALEDCGVRVIRRWYEPNLAKLYNLGVKEAKGDALLFLRAGDRVRRADSLHYMLEFAMQPHVGAVCAWPHEPPQEQAYVKNVHWIMRAPMLARDTLVKAGGFDESLASDGCEAALSIRLREKRQQLVQTPDAVIEPVAQIKQRDAKTTLRCRDLWI